MGTTVEPMTGGAGVEEPPAEETAGGRAVVVTTARAEGSLGADSPVIAASALVAVDVAVECLFFFVLLATEGGALVVPATLEPGDGDGGEVTASVAWAVVDPVIGAGREVAAGVLLCFFRWECVAGVTVVGSEDGSAASTDAA